VPRERKLPLKVILNLKELQPNVIRGSNPYFRINPGWDPDVCRIAPIMWINYLVGFSHFAECRENLPVTMRNATKSP